MGLLKGRRGGLTRGNIRHSRAPGHLQECSECHAAVLRERQYLERLRRAAVPEASQDFTNRLIEHTQRLAQSDFPERPAPQRSVWHGIRLASAAAGGLAVSAGILAVAAYALGGEVAPQASNRGEQEVRTLVSSTVPGNAGEQLPVTGSQLSLPVERSRDGEPERAAVVRAAERRLGMSRNGKHGIPRGFRPGLDAGRAPRR